MAVCPLATVYTNAEQEKMSPPAAQNEPSRQVDKPALTEPPVSKWRERERERRPGSERSLPAQGIAPFSFSFSLTGVIFSYCDSHQRRLELKNTAGAVRRIFLSLVRDAQAETMIGVKILPSSHLLATIDGDVH